MSRRIAADYVVAGETSRFQCAGLNRLEIEDERALREGSSDPLGLELRCNREGHREA